MEDKKICFLTVATGNWNMFVLPYIFSCLYYNNDACVEVLTRNNQDTKALQVLNQIFGSSFLVHELPIFDRKRNLPDCALRFIIEPRIKLQYTYIGDVDILILESDIAKFHRTIMQESGQCYSNVVRPNSRRLTGLQCVKTVPYYIKTKTIRDSIICKSGSDEQMLFDIVNESISDPLKNTNTLRPIHGFHFSLMREAKVDVKNLDKPSWNVNSLKYQKTYLKLKESKEWKTIYPYFDDKYKNILKTAEEAF